MAGRKAQAPPAPLERLRGRFERWRQSSEPRTRIPDSLWASAARLADRYGLSRTANTLGVNYQALKRRLTARTANADPAIEKRARRGSVAVGDGSAREGTPEFVELPAFVSVGTDPRSVPGECLLEWDDGDGAKMRVRLHGVGMPDLLALGRSFWDRRP